MQILMSEAALARVSDRLAGLADDFDIITMDAGGAVKRGGEAIDSIDPDVFWVSLDLYVGGQLPAFIGRVLQGRAGTWTQIFAAGVDNPAFKAIVSKGIRLSKSSAQAPAIAEYVLANALSLLHPVDAQRRSQEAHEWRYIPFREIGSTRWLIVGMGAIGTAIAERLKPFGAHLTVIRRNTANDPLADAVRPTSELKAALPEADVVVLACALNEETRGMADAAFFAAMKPGAILINIARGALVDEAALKAGLDRDQPATAVLDVFQTEPLPADAWFWDHPKVRVTGHASNAGDGVLVRGDALFMENLGRFRSGEPLLHEASPSEVGL